jgi:hypothetical protein
MKAGSRRQDSCEGKGRRNYIGESKRSWDAVYGSNSSDAICDLIGKEIQNVLPPEDKQSSGFLQWGHVEILPGQRS